MIKKFSLYYSMVCAAYFSKEFLMLIWISFDGGVVSWKQFSLYFIISFIWILML